MEQISLKIELRSIRYMHVWVILIAFTLWYSCCHGPRTTRRVFAIPVETRPCKEMHFQLLLPNDLQSSRTSSSTDLEKIQEQQRAEALLKAVLQSSDTEAKDALLPASDNVESPNTTEEMALDMRYAVVMTTIPPRFVRIYLHMTYPMLCAEWQCLSSHGPRLTLFPNPSNPRLFCIAIYICVIISRQCI